MSALERRVRFRAVVIDLLQVIDIEGLAAGVAYPEPLGIRRGWQWNALDRMRRKVR
jgi:hypothetical protein